MNSQKYHNVAAALALSSDEKAIYIAFQIHIRRYQ